MPHSEYESSVRGCESVFWSWKTVLVWLRGIQALSVNLFFVLRYVAEAVMILPYSGTSEPIRVYFDGINNRSRTGSKRVHINLTHTHTHTHILSITINLSISISICLSFPPSLFIYFVFSFSHPPTHSLIHSRIVLWSRLHTIYFTHYFTLSLAPSARVLRRTGCHHLPPRPLFIWHPIYCRSTHIIYKGVHTLYIGVHILYIYIYACVCVCVCYIYVCVFAIYVYICVCVLQPS